MEHPVPMAMAYLKWTGIRRFKMEAEKHCKWNRTAMISLHYEILRSSSFYFCAGLFNEVSLRQHCVNKTVTYLQGERRRGDVQAILVLDQAWKYTKIHQGVQV